MSINVNKVVPKINRESPPSPSLLLLSTGTSLRRRRNEKISIVEDDETTTTTTTRNTYYEEVSSVKATTNSDSCCFLDFSNHIGDKQQVKATQNNNRFGQVFESQHNVSADVPSPRSDTCCCLEKKFDEAPINHVNRFDLVENKSFCVTETNIKMVEESGSEKMKKRREISVAEKLVKTEKIWYLPNLDIDSIVRCLANKPIGNFILSVRNTNSNINKENKTDCDTTSRNVVVVASEQEPEYLEQPRDQPLILSRTKLVLYVSSGCDSSIRQQQQQQLPLRQHSIWIDSEKNLLFRFKPNVRFKSIMSLLEYYIIRSNLTSSTTANQNREENPQQNQQNLQNQAPKHHHQQQQQQQNDHPNLFLKLTLPAAIENANHSQDLNSLSLLEQDFWLDKFYLKFSSERPSTQRTSSSSAASSNVTTTSTTTNPISIRLQPPPPPILVAKIQQIQQPSYSNSTTTSASLSSSSTSSKASSPELKYPTTNKPTSTTATTTTASNSTSSSSPVQQQQQQSSDKISSIQESRRKATAIFLNHPSNKFNTLDLNLLARIQQRAKQQQQQQQQQKQANKLQPTTPLLDTRYSQRQQQQQQQQHQSIAQSPSSNSLINRMQQWPSRLFGSTQNRGGTTPIVARKNHQQQQHNHLDGSLDTQSSPRSHHHQLSEFVNQLVESQTNTPRLELKRNQHTKLLHHSQQQQQQQQQQPQHLVDLQKSRFKCESFSSLAGSALLDRVAAKQKDQQQQPQEREKISVTTATTNQSYPIGRKKASDSDNLSIVSSCISFLDEHLRENITTATNSNTINNQHHNNKLLSVMDSTNEYSEPFDYFTSLPPQQHGSSERDKEDTTKQTTAISNTHHHHHQQQPLVLLSSSLSPSSASPSSSFSSSSNHSTNNINSSSPKQQPQQPSLPSHILLSSPSSSLLSSPPPHPHPHSSTNRREHDVLPPLHSEYESVRDVRIVGNKVEPTDKKTTTTTSTKPDNVDIVVVERRSAKDKSVEEIKTADVDLFKSTITAFDILSERCSELLGLFDNDNENEAVELSVNSLTLNRQNEVLKTVNKETSLRQEVTPPPAPPPPLFEPHKANIDSSSSSSSSSSSTPPPQTTTTTTTTMTTEQEAIVGSSSLHGIQQTTSSSSSPSSSSSSKFLERTLTFDCLIKSSALLSSSSSITPICSNNQNGLLLPNDAKTTTTTPTTTNKRGKHIGATSSSNYSSISSSSCSFEDELNNNQMYSNSNHNSFNSIRSMIFKMAKNEKTLFGKSVIEFLACTNKSREQSPITLMSNTRQFMNGIKNYLIRNLDSPSASSVMPQVAAAMAANGCEELKVLIERERASLDPTQILNLDSILEDCLQCIVLRPLKARIYYLLVDHLVADHSLILMSKSIKLVSDWDDIDPNLCSRYLGIKSRPGEKCLKRIRDFYTRMQCEYAPLVKLKYVLFIVNELINELVEFELALTDFCSVSASSLLPPLIYAISKCGMYAFQIELEYIWSLANRQLLTPETLFYLTLMSSACSILKSLEPGQFSPTTTHTIDCSVSFESASISGGSWSSSSAASSSSSSVTSHNHQAYLNPGLLHVYLPDDKCQTLKVRCLPIRTNSKTRECVQMLMAKFKLYGNSNQDEYALSYMENGQEVRVRDDEKPYEIKKSRNAPAMKFIFRQRSANFLWPKSIESC